MLIDNQAKITKVKILTPSAEVIMKAKVHKKSRLHVLYSKETEFEGCMNMHPGHSTTNNHMPHVMHGVNMLQQL